MAAAPGAADLHPDGGGITEAGGDTLGSGMGSDSDSPSEVSEPGRGASADGAGSGECPDEPGPDHVASDGDGNPESIENLGVKSDGDRNPGSVEHLGDAGQTGWDGDEGSPTKIDTDAEPQPAADPEFESTPDDNSDPHSEASCECEDGYSSDDTSGLSEGEKLAFEQRRAEIRRGKAREGSPVPSEALVGAMSVSQPDGQPSRGSRDGSLLPVAGPVQEGDPEVVYVSWERDAERPLQKLPIRFRDLNGRTFLLPWEKVKTWGRAKTLIRKIHGHHERLLKMIDDGEYHLLAKNVWANEDDAAVGTGLTSYPRPPTSEPHPSPGPSGSVPPQPNNPMAGGRSRIARTRDAVVLPELWDVVVEPGMYVDMVAWHPGAHPVFGQVAPPQAGRGRGWGVPVGAGRGFAPPPDLPGLGGEMSSAHVLASLTQSQQDGLVAMVRAGGRRAGVAPRWVVRTRVKQRR